MTKILIVDDYERTQILFSEVFMDEGYDVLSSEDASGVMEMIDQMNPDLVVMEIDLQAYDGLDILQNIRKSHYDLPVILWTASPYFKGDPRVIAADYCVFKSADMEELKKKVEMALECSTPLLLKTMLN
ncbi:MAG: response regulator [Thermodesulfobacteriota bacterium]|nr:response regulator [Thermodesulfobacteriota bacterium]